MRKHTDEARAKAVAMYKAGRRIAEICHETGMPRATVFWTLKEAGVRPDRIARAKDDVLTMSDLLDALRQSEQEVGRLTTELQRERVITRELLGRMLGDQDA